MKRATPGYSGGETLAGADARLRDASILNFWQWAYSDLTNNVNRGVFAEWMVAKLLDVDLPKSRTPWEAWDIETPERVRIEVKASAYVHQWTPADGGQKPTRADPAKVVFTKLRTGSRADHGQAIVSREPVYNADLYVFCLQAQAGNPEQWKGLDLGQWEFYVLPKSVMEKRNSNSMRLSVVDGLSGGALSAGQFQEAGRAMISELAKTPEVKSRKGR